MLPSVVNKKYCRRNKNDSHVHLFGFLVNHLKKHHELFGNKSEDLHAYSKLATKIIMNIKYNANIAENEKYDPKLMEIQKIFGEIVSETLTSIMNRTPGSGKGIMYYKDFYKEVHKKNEGYIDTLFHIANNIKDYEYPHFTLGNDFHHYITKCDIPASKALDSLLEGPTAVDCGSCIEVVYLKSILQFLGEDKFDVIFSGQQDRMQIRKWVSPDIESSLFPFFEFVDPLVTEETNENSLKIGDHVAVHGVPWYNLKHPEGNMQNMHGIVVGYNEAKEPLIGGLELKTPLTLEQIKFELVDFYNSDQTKEDLEFASKFLGEAYLSPDHIDSFFSDTTGGKKFNKSEIFKRYTVDEIKTFGGCKIQNAHSCRISPFILGVLKGTTDPLTLRNNLTMAKTVKLVKQYIKSKADSNE